jgi:hypothetical protein
MTALVSAQTQNAPAILLTAKSAADTAAATGSGVDLTGYEGAVAIVQQVGACTGSIAGKIQDSADNSSFADVTGATFTTVAAAGPDKVQSISVDVRNVRRYVKYVGTVVTGPSLVSVVLNGFKKVSA